jgi:hypothetical protein
MKSRIALAVLMAATPADALAGVPTVTAMLGKVPAVPHDAAAAYAQWSDANGTLSKGAAFTGLENELNNGARTMMTATLQGRGSMSMGPVSEHDQAMMKKIQPYPQTTQLHSANMHAGLMLSGLRDADENAVEKLHEAENAELSRLAVCPGEAGLPSDRATLAVKLKYADQRVALANATLGKEAPIVESVRHGVVAETTYIDNMFGAWASMSGGMMKTVSHPNVVGMQAIAMSDVGLVLTYVEDASKSAAQAVAEKNRLARDAANAKGC